MRVSFAILLLLCLWALTSACSTLSTEDITLTIRQPLADTQLTGFALIDIDTNQARFAQELLIGLRSQKDPRLIKILHRSKPNRFPFLYEWDTLTSPDGAYEIFVELRVEGDAVGQRAVKPLWIVNGQARLQFAECNASSLIVRDRLKLTVEWLDIPPFLPPTPVELYLQGEAAQRLEEPPYQFDVDISSYAHGQEISIAAIVLRGLYRGTTTNCVAYVDRQGPRLRFLSPDPSQQIVPQRFTALFEIQEEYGVKYIEIHAESGGQPPVLVGRRETAPFQVPVDLSSFPHEAEITLRATATDEAGNTTAEPDLLNVKLDGKPPIVEIIEPKPNAPHLGRIRFEARARDESGIESIAFYLDDDKGQRLDNLLFRKGAEITSDTFQAEIEAAISLYRAGIRRFVVVATDKNNNQTTATQEFIIGCLRNAECPASNPPYQCLGNRCIIPEKLGGVCEDDLSCEGDLVCFKGGLSWCASEKLGICRERCTNGNCPQGYFCLSGSNHPSLCFPGDPCSPFTANCSADHQCVPWGKASFVCVPTGNGDIGASCLPYRCSSQQSCRKGLACLPSGTNSGTCRTLCDQQYPQRECGAARRCSPFPLRDQQSNSMGYCN